ncbi:MAG: response regulator transcription factor [Cytophagales bacterium]|nr:response regulator transcription factor [Bernardetiaceae bacterium]MDW8205994.1 response regulator transcription factor [Cytophagales bacterium]
MIKVALVDDHQIIRDGIKKLLSEEPDIAVVLEAADIKEAQKLLDEQPVDLLITDISMPNGSGFDLIKAVAPHKDLKVLILSMHTEEAYVRKALEMGVSGYLTKDISRLELVRAIQAVHAGETYFSNAVSQVMMNTIAQRVRRSNNFDKPAANKLTLREKEIVRYILDGLSSPEIAEKLFISHRTVENHRANIMNKLKVRNTIELVRKVLEVDFWEKV